MILLLPSSSKSTVTVGVTRSNVASAMVQSLAILIVCAPLVTILLINGETDSVSGNSDLMDRPVMIA